MDSVFNDDVEVGKIRKIAARGVTPNHRYKQVTIGEITGELWYYEHFDKTTVLTLLLPGRSILTEFDLGHLDEIEVEV